MIKGQNVDVARAKLVWQRPHLPYGILHSWLGVSISEKGWGGGGRSPKAKEPNHIFGATYNYIFDSSLLYVNPRLAGGGGGALNAPLFPPSYNTGLARLSHFG